MKATKNAKQTKKQAKAEKVMAKKPEASKKPAKAAKATSAKTAAAAKPSNGKLSQIEAAIEVLRTAKEPMSCKAMVEAMGAKGLWTSPGGKTPDATLYASTLRELKKGDASRFVETDRFCLLQKRQRQKGSCPSAVSLVSSPMWATKPVRQPFLTITPAFRLGTAAQTKARQPEWPAQVEVRTVHKRPFRTERPRGTAPRPHVRTKTADLFDPCTC